MKEKRIQALMIEPGKHPCVVELKNDLDSLQKAVSIGAPDQGLVEFVYIEDNVSILCNEEGKLMGLAPNRRLDEDILCGVFYIVAEGNNGDLKSLTYEQQDRYSKMFWNVDTIDKSEVERTVFSIFFGG